MTIHHIVHVEGLGALTDLVQKIYEELNVMNTRATCPVKVIDEPEAKVDIKVIKDSLGVDRPPKERWNKKEDLIIWDCIARNMKHEETQKELRIKGYNRSMSAVKHRVNLFKRVARKSLKYQ